MSSCIIPSVYDALPAAVDVGYIATKQYIENKQYAYITTGGDDFVKCPWTDEPEPITYDKEIEITEISEVRTIEVSAEQRDFWTLSTGCTSLCENIQCPLSGLWFVTDIYNIYHSGDCGYRACYTEGTYLRTINKEYSLTIDNGEGDPCNYTNTTTISVSADGECGELSSTEVCEPSGRSICTIVSGDITYYYLTDGNCSYYRTASCPPSGAVDLRTPPVYVTADVPNLGTEEIGIIETFFGQTPENAADCVTYEVKTCYENSFLGPASPTTSWYCSACEVYEAIDCPAPDTFKEGSHKELSAANGLTVGYLEEFYTGGRIDNMTCKIVTVSTCPPEGTPLGVINNVVYTADGSCGYTVQCPESGTIVSLAFREAYTPLSPAISAEVGYSDLIYTGTEINEDCVKIRKYNCLPKGTQIQESPNLDLSYNFFADGGNNNSQPCGYILCHSLSAKIVINTVPEKVEIFCRRSSNSGGAQLSTVEVGYREVMYDGGYDIFKSTCSTITGDCISFQANVPLCVGVDTTIYTDGFCGVKECGNVGTRTTELVKTTIDDVENNLHGEITIGYIDKVNQGPGSGRDCVSTYENFRCLPAGRSMGNLGGTTLYSNGGVPDDALSGNCGYNLCPLSGTVIPYSNIMALPDYSVTTYPLSTFGTGRGCDGGMYTYIWGGLTLNNTCAIQSIFNYWPDMTFIYSDESNTYYATGSGGDCKSCPNSGTITSNGYMPGSLITVEVPELSLTPGYPQGGYEVAYQSMTIIADGMCGTTQNAGNSWTLSAGSIFGSINNIVYYYNGTNGYISCYVEGEYIPNSEAQHDIVIYNDQNILLTTINDGLVKYKSAGFDTLTVSCSYIPEYYNSMHSVGDLLFTDEYSDPIYYYLYARDPDNYYRGTYTRTTNHP